MARRRTTTAQARLLLEPSVAAVQDWLAALLSQPHPPDLGAPSVLPGWSVRDLAAHLVLVADSVVHLTPLPVSAPVLPVAEYLAGYPAGAEAIAERTRALASSTDDLPDELGRRWRQAWERVDELGGVANVQARRGPIRLADFLVTRVLEIVVHADDLARSVPGRDAPPVPPQAERLVVRVLLDSLAQLHPGQALEVRVPPVAAVQCLAGPRHTRGTPPGVVETDPRTWLRLATGRLKWAEALAAGAVRASGERADLAPLLPLL